MWGLPWLFRLLSFGTGHAVYAVQHPLNTKCFNLTRPIVMILAAKIRRSHDVSVCGRKSSILKGTGVLESGFGVDIPLQKQATP